MPALGGPAVLAALLYNLAAAHRVTDGEWDQEAERTAALEALFSSGDLLVHATMKQQYLGVYGQAVYSATLKAAQERREKELQAGGGGGTGLLEVEGESSTSTPPDIAGQMANWNRTGRLYGALSTSQIRPEYKGSTLYGELGILLDGRKCDLVSAAAADQWISNRQIAQGGEEKAKELLRVAVDFSSKINKARELGALPADKENFYKLYVHPSGDDERFEEAKQLGQVAEQEPDTLRLLRGTQEQVWAAARDGVTRDVALWLGDPRVRNMWIGYTEFVVGCPVEAILGGSVTLATWKGNNNFDTPLLLDIQRTWIQEMARLVPKLKGTRLAVAQYVPGGGVPDSARSCSSYCGDPEQNLAALDPAQLQVVEWVTV